jgi:hypothetical protein
MTRAVAKPRPVEIQEQYSSDDIMITSVFLDQTDTLIKPAEAHAADGKR